MILMAIVKLQQTMASKRSLLRTSVMSCCTSLVDDVFCIVVAICYCSVLNTLVLCWCCSVR